MDGLTEALLYAASRHQHVVEKIAPELDKGNVVICDRYLDSSLVYQGIVRDVGLDEINLINKFAIRHNFSVYYPDLTFVFNLDPSIGLKRVAKRNETNRLDLEDIKFHEKVYEGYQRIIEASKYFSSYTNYVVIDASRPEDEVFNNVYEIIKKRCSERNIDV